MTAHADAMTAPRLFDFVERAQTQMPDWYMPSAPGVLISGKDMLTAAGHGPGAPPVEGWSEGASGWKKLAREGNTVLWVQKYGQYWTVERVITLPAGEMVEQALSCPFGGAPIWAPTREAAMRLAEHCEPIPRPPVAAHWAPTNP